MKKKKTAKTEKSGKNEWGRRRPFRFSLAPGEHADVISTLDSIPKSLRGLFIAEAIRHMKKTITATSEPGRKEPLELKGTFSM